MSQQIRARRRPTPCAGSGTLRRRRRPLSFRWCARTAGGFGKVRAATLSSATSWLSLVRRRAKSDRSVALKAYCSSKQRSLHRRLRKWRRVIASNRPASATRSPHPAPRGALNTTVTTLDDLDALLTPTEAAKLLRLSQRTLERFRTAGTGPRFLRLGRAIRYAGRDLQFYLERCARRSTSEAEPQP